MALDVDDRLLYRLSRREQTAAWRRPVGRAVHRRSLKHTRLATSIPTMDCALYDDPFRMLWPDSSRWPTPFDEAVLNARLRLACW